MTIHVRWLVENRIILAHFSEDINGEQLRTYLDVSFEMRDTANEIQGEFGDFVHTITDGTEITKQAVDLGTIQQIMQSLRSQKVGWSLYVSPKGMDRFLSSLAHQFAGIRFQSFATMDEAIQFLRENDESLQEALNAPLDFSHGVDVMDKRLRDAQ